MRNNPITCTIGLNGQGVRHGHLKLPYSHDRSAWGSIMIPITVIAGGDGPTVLMTGANHGDEYEGPIALMDLALKLDPRVLSGRVIIVPMMNYPAFRAGLRTSPVDGGNMNRVFPGRPDGTVTEKIADYFQRTLLPMADIVLDIHSGGKTLDFVPFAAAHVLQDKAQQERCVAALTAFNAPYHTMLLEIDSRGMYDSAVEDMGKVFITTELGGGGSASAATTAITRRGIDNLLRHAGLLDGDPEITPSQKLEMPGMECFVFCDSSGLLEMTVDPGDMVRKGQVVGRVHNVERTGLAPAEYTAAIDGILAGRHFPGLIEMGDMLALVAVPV